jgi:hypothetical protein
MPLTVVNCSQLLFEPTVLKVGITAGAAATFTVKEVWVKGVPALEMSNVTVYVPAVA